jgi:hypothetical protein
MKGRFTSDFNLADSRYDSLEKGSARRKAATYTQNNADAE